MLSSAEKNSQIKKFSKNYDSPLKIDYGNVEKRIRSQNIETPFSKFINGLSPISKISQEAANEISNFKNLLQPTFTSKQKLNYYLITPSPQNKQKQLSVELNAVPLISNKSLISNYINIVQLLKFDLEQVIKKLLNSFQINLNSEVFDPNNLNNELDLQEKALNQSLQNKFEMQQSNNSLDLANLMYEFKLTKSDLNHVQKSQKSFSSSEEEEEEEKEKNNFINNDEFLNQLQIAVENNQPLEQIEKIKHLSKKLDNCETPKQRKEKDIQKFKISEDINFETKSKSSLKTLQKTSQLSKQLKNSLAKISNKNENHLSILSTEKKKVGCNCKKSKCLKLYCECFANGQACTKECNCYDCANTENNSQQRYNSMLQLLERNPFAFKPKVDKINLENQHLRGCNCTKSGCIKKYCECYQAGVKCTPLCKCLNCKNKIESPEKIKKKIKNEIKLRRNNYL